MSSTLKTKYNTKIEVQRFADKKSMMHTMFTVQACLLNDSLTLIMTHFAFYGFMMG